jgi:GDPmannose 4,6-dehydratase
MVSRFFIVDVITRPLTGRVVLRQNKSNNTVYDNVIGKIFQKVRTTDFKGKRVLITGAGGFVGSYLARRLLDNNAQVFGLVRNKKTEATTGEEKKQDGTDRPACITGDIEDYGSLERAIQSSEPDYVFHLAAQSYVPQSVSDPLETARINCLGTNNLLEAIRNGGCDPVVIFAGSPEEYGLVFSSYEQYERLKEKYGSIFPEPDIPEIPIKETNPLRPMSPYAVSKVFGDHLMRSYFHTYGVKTVVSRAFNHEGAGRGLRFVTSVITRQVANLSKDGGSSIVIGNVNSFRDWSHVNDVVRGYTILADRGKYGDVYNQGTMKTISVLSYLLMSIEKAGYRVRSIEAFQGGKKVLEPLAPDTTPMFGIAFEKTKIDQILLSGELEYTLQDEGILVRTDRATIPVRFDTTRFRPSEVPILLADIRKIREIGFTPQCTVEDIIRDQLAYFSQVPGSCP